jgi:hypothetical protein
MSCNPKGDDMKKTVKCSGCGKEHEIEHTIVYFGDITGHHSNEDITFKAVESIRDRLFADLKKVSMRLECECKRPYKLYLGKQELDCFECGYDKIWGFDIVVIDKTSYFHATGQ